MGMPTILTQNQTGTSAIWFPDWMQSPFSIAIQAIATGAPTYNIEYTLDNIDIAANTTTNTLNNSLSNATTAGAATWFQSAITGQTISTTGTIAAPVRAIRVNIVSSSATAFLVATFIQATYPGS